MTLLSSTNRALKDRAPDRATEILLKLNLARVALLLDVDGTLVDIAPTPGGVEVPDGLREALKSIERGAGGAAALVSGRPISDLDHLFEPLKLSAVGGHGAEMRIGKGAVKRAVGELPTAVRECLAPAVRQGAVLEDKGYSIAVHYRTALDKRADLEALLQEICEAFPSERLEILPGKAMFEIKRGAVSKGEGVRALMLQPPFAGRKPVFIGDDVTDESVFDILPEFGGIGLSVGHEFAPLDGMFTSPGQVRAALRRLADKTGKKAALKNTKGRS